MLKYDYVEELCVGKVITSLHQPEYEELYRGVKHSSRKRSFSMSVEKVSYWDTLKGHDVTCRFISPSSQKRWHR